MTIWFIETLFWMGLGAAALTVGALCGERLGLIAEIFVIVAALVVSGLLDD